jgi:uncharacterized membrane protein YhaH (DUF805 family)
LFAGVIAAWALGDVASGTLSTTIIFFILAACVLQTVRRLHDGGFSRWWAVLLAFPFSITIDLASVQIGPFDVQLFDITDFIRYVPLVLALVVPSNLAPRDEERNLLSARSASKSPAPGG